MASPRRIRAMLNGHEGGVPGVHGGARLRGRAGVGAGGRGRRRGDARTTRAGEGRGAVGAAPAARGGRHRRRVSCLRGPERGDRPVGLGAARLQLPGAGRRQRRDPPPVRHRRAEVDVPPAAGRGRDAVVLLDDGAGGLGRGPDRAADDGRAGRRRVGDRRSQVVLVGGRGRRVRDRHGGHRSGRGAAPADVADPRSGRRARAADRARAGLRSPRPRLVDALRGLVLRRACARRRTCSASAATASGSRRSGSARVASTT